ncbi:TraR/DksA family transcriptional regulator [Coralliovum pocilloporae]|uniref:TraR/DksA family transcriptional regulator n=1 Tax=Coralliovum pocilloporae TaxID=3066369 RepID=UPI00330781B2
MTDIREYAQILTNRKQELAERLQSIETALDQPGNPDFEEQATEREGDEVMEDLGNAGLDELRAIDAALDRIAAGTFGVCIECEEPISEERLAVVPTAFKCRNCMS